MRLKAHRMRPLSFLFLLGWIYGAGASQITVDRAGESCESDRITVAVSSTSINGCYIRTDPGSRGFDAIYEKEDAAVEGTTYHILGPWVRAGVPQYASQKSAPLGRIVAFAFC